MSFLCTLFAGAATLFDKGRTTYSIVIGDEASASEKTAAKELQHYLEQISGAEFAITNLGDSRRGNRLYIGYNSKVKELTGKPQPTPDDESFVYQSVGDDILIYGGSRRGTMYGVYSFLENELGVRWYTAECTKVPKRKSWKFKNLDHSEKPFIEHRYTMYYRCAEEKEWAARNKNNWGWNAQQNEYGGIDACLGAHTLAEYIPQEEFFAKHPEYFALRDGKRNQNAQRCMSNKAVLDIVTKRVLEKIGKRPGYTMYDVSQLDNELYCECENCQRIEKEFGGRHSGLVIWFVNQVAAAVARQYPDKKICTLAYQYTRQAPKNIKPLDNVVVRLCDIECCFAHPLSECEKNKSFVQDFKDWGQLTPNIFIWDYVVNFGQFLMPYPNFGVLAENIKTFKRHGVSTVLELGQYKSHGGEFGDLKAWVLAKLLWNPAQNTDSLVGDFIQGYYGPAAPYIQKYFNLCQGTITATTHIYQNRDACHLYSDAFIAEAEDILDKAYAKAKDDETRARVETVLSQIMYLKEKLHPIESKANGNTSRFNEYIKKTKPHIRESQSADKYLEQSGYT